MCFNLKNNKMNPDYTPKMSEADMKTLSEEMERIDAEIAKKNKVALEFVAKNINYPLDLITDILDDNDYWEHLGYVKIQKSDYKNPFYKSYDFYTIVGEKLHFMMQDNDGEYHNLVWQTTGHSEDDYSGYMLFPLSNGDYWKISYSC
jgi:hypothetical protein